MITGSIETATRTRKEFAALWQVDYNIANQFINWLLEKGLATKDGSRPNPNGKGKGVDVYRLPCQVSMNLGG